MGLFGTDSFSKKYKATRTLGTGSFATVKICTLKTDKDVVRAVKIMNLSTMKSDDLEALDVEIEILSSMDHPHIVHMYESFKCSKYVYLVMEIMQGGEMFDRIVAKTFYSEALARKDLTQLASALKFCHEKGIVHRDLKPENLLYSDASDDALLKLADFGLAKIVDDDTIMKTRCGTPGYVAPEVLMGHAYDKKVDTWSFGIIAYIILCGFPPFYHQNNAVLFEKIKSGKFPFPSPYWDNVSQEAKSFISSLLVVDSTKRPSMEEILQHPWMIGEMDSDLSCNLEKFKEYNSSRKFKSVIKGIQITNWMRKTVVAAKSDDQPPEEESKSSDKKEMEEIAGAPSAKIE